MNQLCRFAQIQGVGNSAWRREETQTPFLARQVEEDEWVGELGEVLME